MHISARLTTKIINDPLTVWMQLAKVTHHVKTHRGKIGQDGHRIRIRGVLRRMKLECGIRFTFYVFPNERPRRISARYA